MSLLPLRRVVVECHHQGAAGVVGERCRQGAACVVVERHRQEEAGVVVERLREGAASITVRERQASLSGRGKRRRQRAASIIIKVGELSSGSIVFVRRGVVFVRERHHQGASSSKGGSLR